MENVFCAGKENGIYFFKVWSVVGEAAAANWSQWVGRTVSGYVGTLNFRF